MIYFIVVVLLGCAAYMAYACLNTSGSIFPPLKRGGGGTDEAVPSRINPAAEITAAELDLMGRGASAAAKPKKAPKKVVGAKPTKRAGKKTQGRRKQ